MTTQLTLGYMPLTDSLPLLAARELGFFEDEGLEVELREEVSWANIRDKVIVGQLDAAQMLAPMVLASSLGLGGLRKPMIAPFSLNLGGNAVTLSTGLYSKLAAMAGNRPDGATLRRLLEQRARQGEAPLMLAVVFPYSSHNLLLRYWLASSGIDPDRDIKTVVLPPSQMVDHLRLGHIDGFCAGAPWNAVAMESGTGCCMVTGRDIWKNAPNKVLGMTAERADESPDEVDALIRALHRSGAWLDDNREQASTMLSDYIPVEQDCLRAALLGKFAYGNEIETTEDPDLLVFHRYLAGFPWTSHGYWFLQQMDRWGWIPNETDLSALASKCYRPDIYRRALHDTPLPAGDWKAEGTHSSTWTLPSSQGDIQMGADTFIDGEQFSLETAEMVHQSETD